MALLVFLQFLYLTFPSTLPHLGSETSIFSGAKIQLFYRLANQMRSSWEKIHDVERNLKKYGERTDAWMVNRRMHFCLKKIKADMLENCPLIV